jgi:hypothetical protein
MDTFGLIGSIKERVTAPVFQDVSYGPIAETYTMGGFRGKNRALQMQEVAI